MKGDNHHLCDNFKKKHLQKNVTAQITSYAYHPGLQLAILSKSVQQQGNGVDCGVHVIAFATSLVRGGNPEKESYDDKKKKKVRPHLVECLKIVKLTPFPKITGEIVDVILRLQIQNYTSYAAYHMYHQQMKGSKEWYHRVCERIPAVAFENLRKKWYYTVCSH